MGGAFVAASCFVPAVGNGYDDDWIFISRTTVGAIVGMALWLLYAYSQRTVTNGN